MTTPDPVDMGYEALKLAGIHWPVLPLCHPAPDGSCGCGSGHTGKNIGKAPIVTNGYKAATIDDATIKAWWKRNPQANIGIALAPAGLLVVAPDCEEWADKFARDPTYGLTPTIIAQSGGGPGHLHYYYARPVGCPTERECKPGEYDILSDGYVVAPPSLHRSGERYSWISAPW